MLYDAKDRINELLEKDQTHPKDQERLALFTILAGNEDLYRKVHYIYDFKEHIIKHACLGQKYVDEMREEDIVLDDQVLVLCSSSISLIKLAFNLYKSFYKADVLICLSELDEQNFKLAMEAIQIRFGRE